MSDEQTTPASKNSRMSTEINELATALAMAQGEFEPALKDSVNPAFKSKYADLSACLEAVRKPLSKHGLAVVQLTVPTPNDVILRTMLIHKSGQWIASDLPIVADWSQPQKVGSGMTYARRYALCAMLQIAQDDDDGEAAMGRGNAQAASNQTAGYRQPPARSARPEPPFEPKANAADQIAGDVSRSRPATKSAQPMFDR